MSGRKARWVGLGLVATASAGVLGLSAMMNPGFARADDIGLVIGGSGDPIPGPGYVFAADQLYLENGPGGVPTYPDITSFYQGTPATLENPLGLSGTGCSLPRGLIRCSARASSSCITTTHLIPMALRAPAPR